MSSVIEKLVGVLMIVTVGSSLSSVYSAVKTETLTKVQKDHGSLEGFTQKLTGRKLKF